MNRPYVEGQPSPGRRRSLRLPGYDYSQPGAYFITIVTYRRQLLFADPAAVAVVETAWNTLLNRFPQTALDAFVVMPNHVHGIIVISDVGAGLPRPPQGEETSLLRKPALGQMVAYFKYRSTKQLNGHRGTPGLPAWQRNYYEHVVRSEAELGRARQYIWDNPARWDLDPDNPAHATTKRRGDS